MPSDQSAHDAADPDSHNADARTAVAHLVDTYGGQLHSLALRFCGDATEAEDLTQEVFLQAFRRWSTFEHRSDPKTWLYTIAARACQRMHRRRAGEPERIGSLDDLLPFSEPRIAAIADEQADGIQQQIHAEARDRMEAAITTLPTDFRVPLILKEIVGFTVPEVAAILGIEPGTARSRVHRARLKLRAAIDSAIPRRPGEAPPPAYPQQTCLDLLDAKQEALDRGVPFDTQIICDRCRSVFASLDLTQQACHDLAHGQLPTGLRERLTKSIEEAAG